MHHILHILLTAVLLPIYTKYPIFRYHTHSRDRYQELHFPNWLCHSRFGMAEKGQEVSGINWQLLSLLHIVPPSWTKVPMQLRNQMKAVKFLLIAKSTNEMSDYTLFFHLQK